MTAGRETLLRIEEVSKTFVGQRALDRVSFDIEVGEVHALLGHNGSGKSTLIKVLAGFHVPDKGSAVTVRGEPLDLGSPVRSAQAGLRFVHQDLALIDDLTVVENMALTTGYAQTAVRTIDWPDQRTRARELLARLDSTVDIDRLVGDLPAIDRSIVAVARALDGLDGAGGLLVLDEPTAALPPDEVDRLFDVVRSLRALGVSVLYVTHRMDEVFILTDRLTVLRDGKVQATGATADFDSADLFQLILGEGSEAPAAARRAHPPPRASTAAPAAALDVVGLRSAWIDGIDLQVAPGEVVGVAGMMGSGREHLGPTLVGAEPATAERFRTLRGSATSLSPRATRSLGVVLVPGSRGPGSMIDDFSVTENLTLPTLDRYQRFGKVRRAAERSVVREWIARFELRPPRPEAALRELSGGNKQKVLVAKWMNTDPGVLVMDEPTAGVDVGASAAIHDFVLGVAAEGLACVVISSDLDDLVAVASRVLVMDHGRIVAEVAGDDVTDTNLLAAMSYGPDAPPAPASLSPEPRTAPPR